VSPNLAAESRDYVDHYREKGYAVVRGVFPRADMAEAQAETRRIYAEGLKHHATYRDRNLMFEVLPESFAGKRYVLQAHWFAWISPYFEAFRRDPRYYRVLAPLLGRNIKQVVQQLHWKPPGAGLTGFRFHQDWRFRDNMAAYRDLVQSDVTTGLAVDPSTRANGCLRVIAGSHRLGYLGLSDDGPLMKGETQAAELRAAGLDTADIVDLELEPGDLALWGLMTVHGSLPNGSDHDRALALSSYVKAEASDRGEWAFKDGQSTPLGAVPELCKYEQLREKPGPFYVESRWYED
jgi:ectoine hydroxylase-related dioxygenase (phytanoyl-CoA dioxygenase family)